MLLDWGTFTDDAAADVDFRVIARCGHQNGVTNYGSDVLHEVILCERLNVINSGHRVDSQIINIVICNERWTNLRAALSDIAKLVDTERPHFTIKGS